MYLLFFCAEVFVMTFDAGTWWLAVLLLGAFGYALLTALCSQIEQFGATAWSRTFAAMPPEIV